MIIITLNKLSDLIRSQRFSIVHTHSSKAGILGQIAAHRSSTPIILHTVHGWSFHNHMSPGLRFLYIYLERLAYRYSDGLLFVSKKDINRGITSGIISKDNYYLVRSAIPLDKFLPGLYSKSTVRSQFNIPADVPILGNIGRFSAQKDPLKLDPSCCVGSFNHPRLQVSACRRRTVTTPS